MKWRWFACEVAMDLFQSRCIREGFYCFPPQHFATGSMLTDEEFFSLGELNRLLLSPSSWRSGSRARPTYTQRMDESNDHCPKTYDMSNPRQHVIVLAPRYAVEYALLVSLWSISMGKWWSNYFGWLEIRKPFRVASQSSWQWIPL